MVCTGGRHHATFAAAQKLWPHGAAALDAFEGELSQSAGPLQPLKDNPVGAPEAHKPPRSTLEHDV